MIVFQLQLLYEQYVFNVAEHNYLIELYYLYRTSDLGTALPMEFLNVPLPQDVLQTIFMQ